MTLRVEQSSNFLVDLLGTSILVFLLYKDMYPSLILGMFSIGYCYGEGTIMSSLGLSQRVPMWYLLGTR